MIQIINTLVEVTLKLLLNYQIIKLNTENRTKLFT